jgi:hypothetical protein
MHWTYFQVKFLKATKGTFYQCQILVATVDRLLARYILANIRLEQITPV